MYETQSMIHCANIPHEFAKGGFHPTLQERGLSIECFIHDRWKYNQECSTLQAVSNFGVSESPRPLACAIESRVLGPKPKVLK